MKKDIIAILILLICLPIIIIATFTMLEQDNIEYNPPPKVEYIKTVTLYADDGRTIENVPEDQIKVYGTGWYTLPLEQRQAIEKEENKPIITLIPKQIPLYKIYSCPHDRYDGAKIYYVLISEIDLNSEFKSLIKNLISDLAIKCRTSTFSLYIFDNEQALSILYSLYGDMSLKRQTTKEENKILERHNIAQFSGNLETSSPYQYQLEFFPAASSDHSIVGKFIEFPIEFIP